MPDMVLRYSEEDVRAIIQQNAEAILGHSVHEDNVTMGDVEGSWEVSVETTTKGEN